MERLKQLGIDLYGSFKDPAHSWDGHVKYVVRNALEINRKLELGLNEDILELSAIWHDVATELNREQHHLIGAEMLYKVARELNVDIPIESLGLAVKAIEEHRASFKGQFSSKYSEVLSAADRGKPIKEDLIIRCWEYTRPKHESQITCAKAVAEHLKDKYSNTGYARYPDLYMEMYSKELQKIKKFFDNVNFLTILDIVNSALLRV